MDLAWLASSALMRACCKRATSCRFSKRNAIDCPEVLWAIKAWPNWPSTNKVQPTAKTL
ncbi:hypothetical protein D3C75_1311230 [compost metagenome]